MRGWVAGYRLQETEDQILLKVKKGPCKTQWVKVLSSKPDNLSFIPKIHISERIDLHMGTIVHMHIYIYVYLCIYMYIYVYVFRIYYMEYMNISCINICIHLFMHIWNTYIHYISYGSLENPD